MRSGICVKCGEAAVHHNEDRSLPRNHTDILPISMFSHAELDRYVCEACGYVEQYVRPEGARAIRDKWPRVTPRRPGGAGD